jgi:transcriptional regulator of heat shock response
MKITKQQLKQIIQEEFESTLNEWGTPPVKLHLPHDVGTPEKLLAGIEAILANPELASGRSRSQITREEAYQIVNLINNKLMENPSNKLSAEELAEYKEIIKRLREKKKELQTMHVGQSSDSDRSQSYRDTAERELAQQKARASRPVTQLGTMDLEREGKIKKSQLKRIVKEELKRFLKNK